jgi:hypothetical protein
LTERLDRKAVSLFTKNELNRHNTFLGTPSYEFETAGHRFRVGFWETIYNGESYPFPALIVWTPEGWQLIAKNGMIYNDDLTMNMGTSEQNLKEYMHYLEMQWNPAFTEYLEQAGVAAEASGIPDYDQNGKINEWEKVTQLMSTVRSENGEIKFDWAL